MNKAFTLIELLVVVAIMGLLGTVSVGGYRQMQRGMEERGVVENASKFVALASERAQIDRKMTAVYFWNELIREETDVANAIVVGRAVAVRVKGRLSGRDGKCLIDEFGDMEQFNDDGEFRDADDGKPLTRRLYLMDDLGSGGDLKYSVVRDTPQTPSGNASSGLTETYLSSSPIDDVQDKSKNKGRIIQYGYYIDGEGTANDSGWKVGSLYGMEFQTIELPHNYIFGSKVPTSMSKPVESVGTLVFDADSGSVSGAAVGSSTIDIYCIRPGQGGAMVPNKVGTTTKPDVKLNN